MIEYPKIETLYDRNEKFKVVPGALRCPEFALPRRWVVTEKIDGTNIRVGMTADGQVSFAGRTDKAQIPPHLSAYLSATFTPERMTAAFEPEREVILFGEGYGIRIQSGGDYRPDVGFALFDVYIDGWWLEPENIRDVAEKLGIEHAPYITIVADDIVSLLDSAEGLRALLHGSGKSIIASSHGLERQAEGIIARTSPMLFDRRGRRVMWKLKFKDF